MTVIKGNISELLMQGSRLVLGTLLGLGSVVELSLSKWPKVIVIDLGSVARNYRTPSQE